MNILNVKDIGREKFIFVHSQIHPEKREKGEHEFSLFRFTRLTSRQASERVAGGEKKKYVLMSYHFCGFVLSTFYFYA